MGLDVKPDRRAVDAKGLKSPFQPRREAINEFFQALPEGKESNDADRDQQLHQEDGVDLQEEGHAVRTVLLT